MIIELFSLLLGQYKQKIATNQSWQLSNVNFNINVTRQMKFTQNC